MKTRILITIAVLATVATSTGCLWAPDLRMVRNEIERQYPDAEFKKQIELSLGPVSMTFARLVTRFVPEANEYSGYLKDVKRVEVAVYEADHVPDMEEIKLPHRIQKMMDSEGWETMVRVREDSELVWVAYRSKRDRIRQIYVMVLSDSELVLVRAEGNLDRLAQKAMEDHNFMDEFRDEIGIGDRQYDWEENSTDHTSDDESHQRAQ